MNAVTQVGTCADGCCARFFCGDCETYWLDTLDHRCQPRKRLRRTRYCRACDAVLADTERANARRCDKCQHNRRLSALRSHWAKEMARYWQTNGRAAERWDEAA